MFLFNGEVANDHEKFQDEKDGVCFRINVTAGMHWPIKSSTVL